MSIILVNATAMRSSGALTILRQFVNALSANNTLDEYYIFIHPQLEFRHIKNVHYIPVNTVNWLKRIYWDETGLRRWIRKHAIVPDLFISFQNTGAKINSNIPQLIYYHQLLPLVDYTWNVLKKEEFILFLYQKFYAFFVSRYLTSKTHVVVQIPSTQKAFCKKFNFKQENISVIRPSIGSIDYEQIKDRSLDNQFIHFIYPATPFVYKNHIDIVKAIGLLKEKREINNIKVHFTFEKKNSTRLLNVIRKLKIEKNFVFEGNLSYEQLLSLYKSSTALLFPSYIETFGLPLIEAASLGLPIIAMDLPYAKDVIGSYKGAKFVPLHDIGALADAISEIIQCPREFTPLIQNKFDNWSYFFQLIYKLKI